MLAAILGLKIFKSPDFAVSMLNFNVRRTAASKEASKWFVNASLLLATETCGAGALERADKYFCSIIIY